jgi:hypothetical protein
MRNESETDLKILRCIEDGLNLLGDGGKKAANYYLEKNGIKREEILAKPETFRKGLEGILGEKGAKIIESWIAEKLSLSFDLKLGSRLSFVEAVRKIKAEQEKLLRTFQIREK